jgi:hypothetical protein
LRGTRAGAKRGRSEAGQRRGVRNRNNTRRNCAQPTLSFPRAFTYLLSLPVFLGQELPSLEGRDLGNVELADLVGIDTILTVDGEAVGDDTLFGGNVAPDGFEELGKLDSVQIPVVGGHDGQDFVESLGHEFLAHYSQLVRILVHGKTLNLTARQRAKRVVEERIGLH